MIKANFKPKKIMKTIQIYTDDTRDDKQTFQVISSIWGLPDNCKSYSDEVKIIIKSNTRLGTDFKGLHSYNLNDSNWSTLGITFEQVLNKLFEYVTTGKLNIQLTLVSRNRYDSNAGYLKNLLKIQLEDRNTVIGKQFKSLADGDLPALYHRIDQLFIYLLYRDKFGGDGDQFEFYPDSTGKILNYHDKEFPMSGNLPIIWDLEFFELIRILGNSLAKVITLTGWPVKQQELIKFEPQKCSANYLTQSCDILANFFFNYLRFNLGRTDKKYELKAAALKKHFLLDELLHEIIKTFSLDSTSNDVICIDQNLLVTIDPIKFRKQD
jgi:hypothetical protein